MENILLAPICLDALVLDKPTAVTDAFADFSRLPYFDSVLGRQVNPNIPYLSEDILSTPLQNEGLYLPAGIHLHWTLPFALTRALQTGAGWQWPTVPNRWLVTRSIPGEVKKQWVVESDYLYPEGSYSALPGITFPVNVADGHQPYRYMGRQLTLEKWLKPEAVTSPVLSGKPGYSIEAKYLEQLTAKGYGDPNFASLYPNCYSVFGFRDTKPDSYKLQQGLQYDVIGWYSNPKDDFLHPVNSFWLNHAFERGNALDTEKKRDAISNEFDWAMLMKGSSGWDTAPPTANLPERSIYYASLTFTKTIAKAPPIKREPITIVVGNTGTEALAAYLADTVSKPDEPDERSKIEDQINALLVQSEGKQHQLDWGYKFHEMRHEKGFAPFDGGTLWTIRPNLPPSKGAKDSAANQSDEPSHSLPQLADALNLLSTLNTLQHSYDRALDELEDLRRLLFADWCKYQHCAYPPEESRIAYPQPGEVRYLIEKNDLGRLKRKNTQVQFYKDQLKQKKKQLEASLDRTNKSISDKNKNAARHLPTYTLQPTHGQRYWQPRDPVILLAGNGIKPTDRHAHEGKLPCTSMDLDTDSDFKSKIANVRNKVFSTTFNASFLDWLKTDLIEWIKANPNLGITEGANTGFSEWAEQPWAPYLLEWEVEIMPVKEGSNLDPNSSTYSDQYIDNNFQLKVDEVDLTPRNGKGKVVKGANIYSGRSILTPQAKENVGRTLQDWKDKMDKQDLEIRNRGEVPPKDPAYGNIQRVLEQLPKEYYQSQSLGGFHEALLMRQQSFQLPVRDPLAFDDYKSFAIEVAKCVGDGNRTSPEPTNNFNPIRTGVMRLLNLRLVDTFGQTLTILQDGELLTPMRDNDKDHVVTSEALVTPGSPHLVYLPPRLTQPARLDFHWLSADGEQTELSHHPTATPVCGWLIPNNLDTTLMVYEQGGGILGWVEKVESAGNKTQVVWQSAPGINPPVTVDSIPNQHLRNVVQRILVVSEETQETDSETTFFDHFLDVVERALEGIDPENFAQHQALALLIGRPIAVVRASLSLELKGLPAIDHDWNRFRQDLQSTSASTPRFTDNFTSVKFPVRLGDYRQLNDGLVGYWVETDVPEDMGIFFSPQSDASDAPKIMTHGSINREGDKGDIHRHISIADAPETYTMLFDPRGVVHAHCGFLPAHTLTIPPEQYSDVLKAIEVFFLTVPILSPASLKPDEGPTLPLPLEPGFVWSWLGRQNGVEWQETTDLGNPDLNANFPAQQKIVEGWLKLRPDDKQK